MLRLIKIDKRCSPFIKLSLAYIGTDPIVSELIYMVDTQIVEVLSAKS